MLKTSKYLKTFKYKCSVVPLGIDINYLKNSNAKKINLSKDKDEKIILFVGRLSYYKGVEYVNIIEALARKRCAETFAANGFSTDDIFVNIQVC